MRLLLDTNALIWLIAQSKAQSLGSQAKELIAAADTVYASPISLVEIRIKTMLGKLTSQPDLLMDIRQAGLELLDFSAEQADAIMQFPTLVRHDPFDRMLLAQAQAAGLLFMTAETILLKLGLGNVIDATK